MFEVSQLEMQQKMDFTSSRIFDGLLLMQKAFVFQITYDLPSHGIRRRANSILLFYLYLQKERSGLIQHKVCIKCVDEHINDFLSHVKQKDDCSHRQGAPPMLHTSKRVEEPTTSAKRISKEHTARLHSFQGMAEYIMYFDTWILA